MAGRDSRKPIKQRWSAVNRHELGSVATRSLDSVRVAFRDALKRFLADRRLPVKASGTAVALRELCCDKQNLATAQQYASGYATTRILHMGPLAWLEAG